MADKTNVGASVRDRLLNLAKKRGVDFQLLLTRYALERLLYRIGRSEYRKEFVLKGAMLHAVWLKDPFRNTRDLDLHARGDEDAARTVEAFQAILATNVPDGVQTSYSDLAAIVALLRDFLTPPSAAAARGEDFDLTWPAGGPWQAMSPGR
jgi:hypothetical protein